MSLPPPATAIVSLATLLLSLLLATVNGATQLSSSVLLYYNSEFYPHFGQPISQCSLLLSRAKQHGSKTVQIIPAHYWIDEKNTGTPGKCYPRNGAKEQYVSHYCSKYQWDSPCVPFNATTLAYFEAGLLSCFQEAYNLGFNVLVAPHLDDGSRTSHWRNLLYFSPSQKDPYGYSYWDIMLAPVLRSARKVFKDAGREFWFSLQGEMGGTIAFYPTSYIRTVAAIRKYWKGSPATLYVGAAFPYRQISGKNNRANLTNCDTVFLLPLGPPALRKLCMGEGPLLPLSKWPYGKQLVKNAPQITKLFNSLNFIGISSYSRSTTPNPTVTDIESSTVVFATELQQYGIDLASWIRSGGKLIWTEFGVGGGMSLCGDTVAKDVRYLMKYPEAGISGTYTKKLDPWRRPSLKKYMRKYYAAALQLLAAGRGKVYPVHEAFIWNLVSWDVQGVHTATSSPEGSYRDAKVTGWIKKHNLKAGK